MNSKFYLTTQMKLISSSCLLIALSACGSSAETGNGGGSNPGISAGPSRSQTVVISPTSTIPTNLGVSGGHTIKVDNHTGKNLVLQKFELSGSKANIFVKGYSVVKSAFGGVGYDSRINLSGCNALASGSSCVVIFNPDETDGSAALRLNFVDDRGNSYPAAQLLEYSSHVDKQNGFYVDDAHLREVATTNNYSIAIPFVSDDNYKSIEVDSKIITLSKGVDCAKGASKGTHCTALLTLPAADPKSYGYNNTIMLKGTKADGKVNYAVLAASTVFNDTAHVAITTGPVVINATDSTSGYQSLSKTINVVNNGVANAISVSADTLVGDSWIYGNTISGGTSLLTKEITCGGNKVGNLPNELAAADTCQVKFTLTNPDARGSEDYKVTYSGGSEGGKPTTAWTKIYFNGLTVPDYAYNVIGNADFTGVAVNSSVGTLVRVLNTGSKPLQDISYPSSPALPSDITIDPNTSTCSDYTGSKRLLAGESCNYSIKYAPKSVTPVNSFKFNVIAKTAASPSTDVTPAQSISIYYSARQNGNGLIIVNDTKGYEIFANDFDKRVSRVLIQNTGSTDFNLSSITAADWSSNLSLLGPVDATTPGSGNSLELVSSTDGTYSTAKTIPAGAVAALDYTYGPTSTIEDGLAEQNFIGKFGLAGIDYIVVNLTGYKAIDGGVIPSNEVVTTETPEGITNVTGITPTNEFVLIKGNQAKVNFKYTAGAQPISGFLVNDSMLPFGFMVNSTNTTCPTTSRNSQAGTLEANASCLVSYTFLANELNHSLFYTSAVSAASVEINAPIYTIKSATGINVVTPTNKITLTPSSFVNVSAASTKRKVVNATEHTVTFTASAYANSLLPGAQVVVTPTFNAGVYPKNVTSCTITNPAATPDAASCSIDIMQEDTAEASVAVPFNYASTKDSDFNSRNSSITLSNN